MYGISSTANFLILLGVLSFTFIVISALYRSLTQYFLARFVETFRHNLSVRLVKKFLGQPYEVIFDRHSGTIVKTVLSETDQLTALIVYPTIQMLSSVFVLSAVLIVLISVNPWLALLAISILGGLYVLIYFIVKQKLAKYGRTLVKTNDARYVVSTELTRHQRYKNAWKRG